MKTEENEIKLASYYYHVNNGGIMVDIYQKQNDEWFNTFIKLDTSYHGYPNVSSTLSIWGENPKEILEKIGLAFLEAANKVKV